MTLWAVPPVPQVMYRMYRLTGKQDHLRLARYFDDAYFLSEGRLNRTCRSAPGSLQL